MDALRLPGMNYILFDPPVTWEDLLPLTWTRPVSEIRIGILTIREKWEKYLGAGVSWITEDYLGKLFPATFEEDNILINGSILPETGLVAKITSLKPGENITNDGRMVAARLGRQEIQSLRSGELVPASGTEVEVSCISHPWDIYRMNGEALHADFELLTSEQASQPLSRTNQCLNPSGIFIEEGARVECAILNAEPGPIHIGRDAEIMEGSMVRGPFSIGTASTLKLGTKIYGPTTIGPGCKVGGEVNNSVIIGYSNKAHDGFLGNSVIGQWCNIGADSNSSNLKNNYARVKIWNYRQEHFIDSGQQFCGLIMGDHSKCGINTMFNTGTVVGVSANIYGDGFPRNFIPSFSWGGPRGFTTYQFDKAVEVAEIVMSRRGLKLTDNEKDLLSIIFGLTAKYRS